MLTTSAQSNRGQGHFQFSSKQKWTNYSLFQYFQSKPQQAISHFPHFDNFIKIKVPLLYWRNWKCIGPSPKSNMIKQMPQMVCIILTSRLFNDAIKLITIKYYITLQSIKAAGNKQNPNKSHLHVTNLHSNSLHICRMTLNAWYLPCKLRLLSLSVLHFVIL